MKHCSSIFTALLLLFVFISGCKEDDPVPLQAEVKAVLLAGDVGQSKSWKMVTFTEKFGTGAEETFTLFGCASDNIYEFSNNTTQDYEESEGSTKCDPLDASVVEKGTWAFTLDGTILVMVNELLTSSQTAFPFSSIFPYPGDVIELTDSILKIKMTHTEDGTSVVDTFTFNKN